MRFKSYNHHAMHAHNIFLLPSSQVLTKMYLEIAFLLTIRSIFFINQENAILPNGKYSEKYTEIKRFPVRVQSKCVNE